MSENQVTRSEFDQLSNLVTLLRQGLSHIEEAVGAMQAAPMADIRRRTSTSQSVKGVVSADQTVETHGYTLDEQMAEFNAQERAIRERFPQAQE